MICRKDGARRDKFVAIETNRVTKMYAASAYASRQVVSAYIAYAHS